MIETLPPHLIIHLKRFDFDFEKMANVKLNNYYEFPEVIDMYPYTRAGVEAADAASAASRADGGAADSQVLSPVAQPELLYELKGVVIHSGTAQGGHYFSLIKDRLSAQTGTDWYTFNDKYVTPFDVMDLPEEAYGGDGTDPDAE